jgi:hypothetical protein
MTKNRQKKAAGGNQRLNRNLHRHVKDSSISRSLFFDLRGSTHIFSKVALFVDIVAFRACFEWVKNRSWYIYEISVPFFYYFRFST